MPDLDPWGAASAKHATPEATQPAGAQTKAGGGDWKSQAKDAVKGMGYDEGAKALAPGGAAEAKLAAPPGPDATKEAGAAATKEAGAAAKGAAVAGAAAGAAASPALLRVGSRGDAVREIQTLLNLWGSQATLPGVTALDVDGIFGPKTRAAVVAFQREAGESPDGIVGPKTRAALAARQGRVAAAAMTPADKRTLAEGLVVVAGTAGAGDKRVVVDEMMKLPQAGLEVLKDEGAKVWVCQGSVTQVRTDLAGVRPRGWPVGMTWDTVPGLYDPGGNRTIIATRGGRVPPTGDGHGASNLVLHEVGHAIDHNSGASDSPAFVASRTADESTLGTYESQAGSAGREETYAESLARHDADAGDAAAHPNLHRYWDQQPMEAQIFAEIREASKRGGDGAYVSSKIKSRHLRRANAVEKAGMIANLLGGAGFDEAKALEILKATGTADVLRALGDLGKLDALRDALSAAAIAQVPGLAAAPAPRADAGGAG